MRNRGIPSSVAAKTIASPVQKTTTADGSTRLWRHHQGYGWCVCVMAPNGAIVTAFWATRHQIKTMIEKTAVAA
jgi:hypothetical protein